ncbi:ALS operon regulatory protein [Afipia sp. P52-10]|jgi:DNA-binding transcriptional LysR family regulator|uniref:LysR family transcriptional regulator n=1 Tax=Afipia sp. P52-10 TaxID=1429916 RepID=UPI0003DEF505|nr:LysR family transcriptional regulator [Afipia sp. P52-10]ETR76549.1 ALS operon regulatory protein [Afipia sp. P52-10]
MELRHLRYFVATAEALNVTHAAERLRIAQPALTQQLKLLEAEIGTALFNRTSRGVQLTEAGRVFHQEALGVLDGARRAIARARLAADGSVGHIAVGLTESASFNGLVTATLRKFRADYPAVQVTLEEARSTHLVAALERGRIDVAFLRPPVTLRSSFAVDVLLREPMVAALPLDHRLAARRRVRLQDLKNEPFILYPRSQRLGLSDAVVTACVEAGFNPNVVQIAPQISATINLVAGSMGISIVPASMSNSRSDAVRYIPLSGTPLYASLGIAYPAHGLTPALGNLVALAKTMPRR